MGKKDLGEILLAEHEFVYLALAGMIYDSHYEKLPESYRATLDAMMKKCLAVQAELNARAVKA